MADKKFTDLTELLTTATDDILCIVDDPSGTNSSKKITVGNILGAIAGGRAVVSTSAGLLSASTVNTTELSYISGLTSAAQTQINTNSNNVATNITNINTNSTNIVLTLTNQTNINTNSTNIQTNITNISTNSTNINTNSSNISAHGTYSLGISIDGGGSAISTGSTNLVVAPIAGTITEMYMVVDSNATTTLDVWKASESVPTDAASITSSDVPKITAGTYTNNTVLTGWTTAVSEGDVFRFNVDANDNATFLNAVLKITK